jgi:hypothetical protein
VRHPGNYITSRKNASKHGSRMDHRMRRLMRRLKYSSHVCGNFICRPSPHCSRLYPSSPPCVPPTLVISETLRKHLVDFSNQRLHNTRSSLEGCLHHTQCPLWKADQHRNRTARVRDAVTCPPAHDDEEVRRVDGGRGIGDMVVCEEEYVLWTMSAAVFGWRIWTAAAMQKHRK